MEVAEIFVAVDLDRESSYYAAAVGQLHTAVGKTGSCGEEVTGGFGRSVAAVHSTMIADDAVASYHQFLFEEEPVCLHLAKTC